jgi:hypothetical protein
MVLLHDISGKIPMHFMKRFFHALKETTQLSFGNISTAANISVRISNSALNAGSANDSLPFHFVKFLFGCRQLNRIQPPILARNWPALSLT